MAKVLLLEDELVNQRAVTACLSQHEVVVASSVAEARSRTSEASFDLFILDIQLPDGDGFSFFAEIQTLVQETGAPVIFLSGRGDVTDKITGFSLGADDYVTKPINMLEFRARIDAKIRRREMQRKQSNVIKKDGFVVTVETQTVAFGPAGSERPLDMTALEFKLFSYLLKRKDHVLSRETLIQDVWGSRINVSDRAVDTHMSHLRKRLAGTSLSIESVYGEGYRLTNAKAVA